MELWEMFKEWFLSLGEKYNVNPYIFGGIYVGAIPFFFLSLYWLTKNIKSKKSIILPVLSTSFFFVSAYLYLVIAGKNIPVWVYIFISVMVMYGIYSTGKKIKEKTKN
jgi:ABC-type Co2+ transport system permease subunit